MWGGSGTDNNGNVIYAENWVPPPNATLDQAQTLTQDSYNYDALNRLSAVNESSLDIAGGGSWISQFAQVYDYDRYGNRTINQTSTWGTGIPKPNFGVDPATNRLTPPAGYAMSYDAAGNLTYDNNGDIGGTRTYDAENRMKQAWANNQWQTYSYDGDGRRVRREVNGTETWQVYGIGGELLAEYAAAAAPATPQKEYGYRNGQLLVTAESSAQIHWLVTDQLGTPRMVFDETGSLANISRHDYLPFGEELFAGTGGRTPQQGYSASDGVRQHFTQKERDIETGLDFFEARYYASTQGRFTSADPLQASARRRNPQTWNRYTYGLNNPLRFTDPDGENSVDESGDVYLRTKIKTTEVIVQERGGGQIVREAKITITESQTDYVGDKGTVIQSEPTQTSATAVDTGNGVLNYSQDQRDKMANAAQAIVEVSREKGFDATIALGIAQTETHMTTLPSQEKSAAKQTDINPMQLSGGRAKAGDLRGNIAGAIDVFNSNSAPTNSLNQRLQDYNRQAGRAAYANTAEGHINRIRGSVQTRTVTNNLSQRPARFGFPTRPQ